MLDLDWLALVSGIGIFLWGMSMVEANLTKLASGKLHYFIGRWTNNTLSAVITGAVCTALIQSSSLLTLIVLALASSKLLNLKQAIGVIFGANLGTTATGWLVTLLGFKVSLGDAAIYLIGVTALARLFFRERARYTLILSLIISIGLILFSLDLIKNSTLGISETITISTSGGAAPIGFFITGLILAVLFQSSSAVMIMTLSAANAGIINLESAIAVVIGADLGTTSTAALGSINGAKIKKQLALSHFSFNVVISMTGLFLILPQVPTILAWLNWDDPLLPIVTFHSMMNGFGILLFTPFINPFVRFISQRFSEQPNTVEARFSLIALNAPAVALHQLRDETLHFLKSVAKFNQHCLKGYDSYINEYLVLKKAEGIFIDTSHKFSKQVINDQQSKDIFCLLSTVRDGIYSAKSLKDIVPDLEVLDIQKLLDQKDVVPLYQEVNSFFHDEAEQLDPNDNYQWQDVTEYQENFYHKFKSTQESLFSNEVAQDMPIEQISTLLNINKQLYTSSKYFISAINSISLIGKEEPHED
ncbi:Na/Pi cotransporter family protein [Kangiella sediminilitoris]|uniref:Na+/Picotransporter n=1 Tax=Kangiella sediminilitoris TaxID=1144748 RepID=A0A1B3BAR9_9GAMM|nr:Na/Pi symporter [Kangiella sediminilitoris]AOE49864.1 Na+/Picotransporter [Kangiella sediminilitoris]